MLDIDSLPLLTEAARRLGAGFTDLPEHAAGLDTIALQGVLAQVAERLQDNYPYFHPLYAGQMLKPPHPIARLAYALAQFINPNNHALDGGRASSAMEKEAVAALAAMFGWPQHLGHLTSGGTMANLEALWIAGELAPGRVVLASSQAHYTHSRLSGVLKLPFESIPVDASGRMDVAALAARLERGDIGTVVATLGTTAIGSVDPLPRILELRERHRFRLHVDAAYGGYFQLIDTLEPETQAAYDSLEQADSIVIDPHKHGLQPYGCGCVLFRDPAVGRFYRHDSPYTYFTSGELHLGEISLECSRAGAAAVALWATQRLLPLEHGGTFATDLSRCRRAALELYRRLTGIAGYLTAFPPELDIVIFAPRAERASEISRRTRDIFDAAAREGLHLAVARLPAALLSPWWQDVEFDEDTVSCLRSCLMKPAHLDWVDEIAGRLERLAGTP